MGSMNHVILMGNLTRAPEVRRTPTGQAVSDLGLAVNERYQDRSGQNVDRPCFVDVVVWGRQAEACEKHLTKGAPVAVEGRLRFEQWQTPQGERRSRLRVLATRVQFLGRPSQDEAAADSAGVTAGAVTPAKAKAAPAKASAPPPTDDAIPDGPEEVMPF